MEKKLYTLMNWPEIEAVVYSESNNPHDLLGGHICNEGFLVQAFQPKAVSAWVKLKSKLYEMEKVDESGFFAVLIPIKKIQKYTLVTEDIKGKKTEAEDVYAFQEPTIKDCDLKAFQAGIHYEVHKMLGAHPDVINGVSGTRFAVWAPNAIRVSVVGDFNQWDGRLLQMRRLGESGVFDIFIPGIKEQDIYKFEIKCKGGLVMLKSDPYAYYSELRPNTASVVYDIEKYQWNDREWILTRDKNNNFEKPMSIYELHLGSFKMPEKGRQKFYNYRQLASLVIEYVKDMGYTHIELMPIHEHPLDGSRGYQVTGYYAPTSRYGTPDDFMYFIDQLHMAGIGVIFDWVPAHFPRDAFALAAFDGTFLYEHMDPRQNSHPEWGTLLFNYGRPEVSNFLIGSALFLAEQYHADGIRIDAVASMLYRDYGRKHGEWIPNIYGGKENLEAVELMKHMNSIFKKRGLTTMLIAEESTAWPMVTGNVEEGSLGFHYKWNMGWMNDFLKFMKLDPIDRKAHYTELIFSMIYAYSENFILTLSHDEVVHGKGSMIGKMPGLYNRQKFANLRAAYGYMFMHPGKKMLFMGQDFAQFSEWSEEKSIEWELLKVAEHKQMQSYVRDLNALYKGEPALYEQDYVTDGFEWINNISANETILVFVRRDKEGNELLIVASFTPVVRNKYKLGVTTSGKYKEIFNSDALKYGGFGNINPRVKNSEEDECDGRRNSIKITVPPMGIAVFSYTPFSEEEKKKMDEAKKKSGMKKTAKNTTPPSKDNKTKKQAIVKITGSKSEPKNAVRSKMKIPDKS